MTDSEEIAKAERIRLQLLDAISVGVENRARILEIASDSDTPDDAAREIERVFGLSAEHARAAVRQDDAIECGSYRGRPRADPQVSGVNSADMMRPAAGGRAHLLGGPSAASAVYNL
jgi:hypothetical protein